MIETPIVPPTPDKDTSRELLSEKLEDDEPDGIFTFKRKPHVKYHHVSQASLLPVARTVEYMYIVIHAHEDEVQCSVYKLYLSNLRVSYPVLAQALTLPA